VTATETPPASPTLDNPHHERLWLILALLGTAQLMVVPDATVVNIALPSAQNTLHFSDAKRRGAELGMLVTARAFQGAAGALLAPSALSLLTTTFTEPRERGIAFGIYGAIAGGGGAVGLLLGGVLTEYLSWRWCLYVNVVIAVPAVFAAMVLLINQVPAERPRLDVPGAVAVSLGLFLIVYGFSQAEPRTRCSRCGSSSTATAGARTYRC